MTWIYILKPVLNTAVCAIQGKVKQEVKHGKHLRAVHQEHCVRQRDDWDWAAPTGWDTGWDVSNSLTEQELEFLAQPSRKKVEHKYKNPKNYDQAIHM